MVGFFGGGIAALLFTIWNIVLLRRVKKDLLFFIVVASVVMGAFFWLIAENMSLRQSGVEVPWWIARGLPRVLGIATWAVFALYHRAIYRAQEISDIQPRSPWFAAVVCIVTAIGVAVLMMVVGTPVAP